MQKITSLSDPSPFYEVNAADPRHSQSSHPAALRHGTSTEASDPAGMSHLRKVRARQPRRRCVRSEAERPAAHVRVVLSLAPVRGPGYNVSRTNDVPTAERAGSYARGGDACVARVATAATLGILRSQDGEAEWVCAAEAANG